jgi:hypothetical protein
VTILVADLDVDSDNSEGYLLANRTDAEDLIEDDAALPGKVLPANRSDGDSDGIPDFADGYNLNGLGGGYVSAASPFLHMVLQIRGVADPTRVRVLLNYSLSDPTAVVRGDTQQFPLVYRAKDDAPVSDPSFRFYTYSPPGGALRVWRQPGSALREPGVDLIQPGVWYVAADLGFDSTMAKAFYVEGVSAAPASAIGCSIEVIATPGPNPSTGDQVRVSVVDLDVAVNSDNDREFVLGADDEAIEDQGNGFLFWPSREAGPEDTGEVTPEGIVDLMPVRFSVPQALLAAGFRPYVELRGPPGWCRVDFYRNAGSSGILGYLTNATDGPAQVTQQRVLALTSAELLPMAGPMEDWLLRFPATGVHSIHVGIENPGGTGRLIGDSVKVTVRDPSSFYWYGSARGSQSVAFSYPVDSPNHVATQRFPDVARVGGDYRDWTKEKHFVFLHGFNNDTAEAREWNNEMFRRLYWTGCRDNYLGITWFGDEGPDILPGPGLEEYNFDLDVENALHTSPSVYFFLRNTVAGTWGVAPADINLMAHSLGNLVMWDALRINAHLNPGSQLVNNVLSSEAAIWPETFSPQAGLAYSAADGDDPVSYSVGDLIQHSWSFWFRQAGDEAASSAAQVFHSYVVDDFALRTMRFNDKLKRGSIGFGGIEHYDRENVDSFPNDRSPETLHNTPTLMLSGERHLTLGQYNHEDINLPLGTKASPIVSSANNVRATDKGWRAEEHSDLKRLPLFVVFPWYDQLVRDTGQIP